MTNDLVSPLPLQVPMDQTPAELVRTYSIELGKQLSPTVPPHDLRRVLVDGEKQLMNDEHERLKWRKYYEPWVPAVGDDM